MNNPKTKYMTVNVPQEELILTDSSGDEVENVPDFKYLGSWIASTEHDFEIK